LAVFTVGAGISIGIGILMEGISDVITCIKDGIINKNFSWKSWGISKAISYTVSIVCAGFSALKNAVKTAYVAAKGAVFSATTVFTQVVKEGWKLAAKKIGLELSKGVAKELVNTLVNLGLDATVMPEIEKKIQDLVQPSIEKAMFNDENVRKMLQLDALNKNNNFAKLIKNKAMELLYSSLSQNEVMNAALRIAKGIATQKIAGLSTIMAITNTLKAFEEILIFVPGFNEKLKETLKVEAKKAKVDEFISEFNEREKAENAETQCQDETSENRNFKKNIHADEDDIDLSKGKNAEQISYEFQQNDLE
jgi:hypothetical protein